MTTEQLTALLAEHVMHWRIAPDRFLTGDRSWIPRWKFNPLERLEDSFTLLDHSGSSRYAIVKAKGAFKVEVECNGRIGKATGQSNAQTITIALARSLGLEVNQISATGAAKI